MRKLTLLSILFFYAVNVYADNQPNRCAFFSVMISNNTQDVCKLIKKELIYGKMSSSEQVPALILPGTSSQPFEIKQLLAGPEIITTYECGKGKEVSFRSKQGYCAGVHGNVRGEVLSETNIKARYTKKNGSFIWNERGEISWIIE